ncbi:hypothetical protein EW026_g1611 [Hermanssonia centrifuga]|uniref:UBX domain-containing protein n=1 Tax=Hermanssonia centrifuga TaxID=98765 RepID=A0A4S4KRT9_9APHY|nr:hypothetical protein EW026_g1611 [Hermanssonia centrifuga]
MAGGEASGVASSSAPGLSRRTGDESPSSSRVLPDFFIGSYESFVKACAKETEPKIGCAVLVSDEHDDVAEFKRSTLTDPDFVRLLQENDILIWGGDIRDRDAWGAAQKLQATTYPFVAFVALQPRRGSSAIAQNKSILTILSRHQGPSIPTSSGPTSPSTLTTHIADHLLPRVTPVLAQLRSTATERDAALAVATRARERERALRAEQDRAFAESARRDKERIERKMQEEREGKEEERRRSMEEERVKEEQRKREEQRKMWEEKRMAWRRWGRRAFVPREPRPSEQGRGRTIRIGVRMPDGRRAVRFFGQMDSLTAVYAFVDTLFIPEGKAFSSDFDPLTAPDGASSSADESGLMHAISTMTEGRTEEWWGFKLVTTYPRKEVQWEPERKVGEVEGLKSGGQLVVELVDGEYGSVKGKERERRSLESRVVSAKGSESDEYETESD